MQSPKRRHPIRPKGRVAMSETTLEQWLGEKIKLLEELISNPRNDVYEGEDRKMLESLKLARQALSQGDVVWEGEGVALPAQDRCGIDYAHIGFADLPKKLSGKKVHVTIRRPK